MTVPHGQICSGFIIHGDLLLDLLLLESTPIISRHLLINVSKTLQIHQFINLVKRAATLCYLYQFSSFALKKFYRLGSLKNRNLFSQSSGGQKSKIKVLADLVSVKALFLACRWLPSHYVLKGLRQSYLKCLLLLL